MGKPTVNASEAKVVTREDTKVVAKIVIQPTPKIVFCSNCAYQSGEIKETDCPTCKGKLTPAY